jgi:RimJ/RimL family protein N-acetyltransferase
LEDPFIIPSLTTERLVLRPFNKNDLDSFAEIVADPAVIRYATYTGEVMSRYQAWNWLCLMLGHWHMRGFGIWAVEDGRSGELLGRIGLQYLDWFDDVELVWMLKQSTWGQGYASEGARAAIDFGFNTLGLPRITAVIHPGNQPSIRLAERLGLTFERQIERQEIRFYEYSLSNGSRPPPGL